MEARFEEICRKYRDAKREESNVDLLSLKLEIESYIRNLRATDEKNEDLLSEAEDMLIDLIKVIEESRCQPFRPRKLQLQQVREKNCQRKKRRRKAGRKGNRGSRGLLSTEKKRSCTRRNLGNN